MLVEEGMVVYGGTPSLPPYRMVAALASRGVRSVPLSVAKASDPRVLNPRRFDVLVQPYGNAFPLPAYENLRAFHAGGGCLVVSGIPFTHPCRPSEGKWVDLGHDGTRVGHDERGIGTGGFREGGAPGPLAVAPGNPLRLAARHLPQLTGNPQSLDTASLAPEDQVIPLVTRKGASSPAAALIRHQCAAFWGARDVWIGQVAGGGEEVDRYAAEQLLARGILWCLAEKGRVAAGDLRARLARLDRVPKPGPLPERLPVASLPRSWGDTFLPKPAAPARTLLVAETRSLKPEERIALACLQGLTGRRQPVIWLNNDANTQFWLDWHRQKGHVRGYQRVSDWASLFRRFRSAYKGAVVPDPRIYRGDLLALNVAACEDLIVATPELARRLGIPVKRDLRGRFRTYAEGLRWVWRTYRKRLNPHLCEFVHPGLLPNGAFAYAFQWRGLLFWIAGPVDDREPGADMLAERRALAEILAAMPPNGAVMGFPYAGEGVGPGEVGGVGLISRYGKSLVCTDFLTNACVMSGVRIAPLAQPRQPAPPPLERDRVYIALVTSDGDNQNTWLDFFRSYFQHPAYGRFPLSFGMGPAIWDLQPGVAQWYYEHAAPTTEFISDVSGAGYTQPTNFGLAYRDRDRVREGFLRWTARLMKPLGMRTIRLVEGSDDEARRYARALPFCHSLMPDMGRYSGREGIPNLTYSLPDGMPVFRAVTSWRYGKEGFLREVREQVGTHRPAFVNGFVHVWTFRMEDLARIWEQRDPVMVFVTPAQLAALYRQARERGWVQ